ncbi:MAG: agmatinase family protein [Bacteroidales bacterium]|jgi:agmatinase|nr:agmatinase family protein [Bacteroidales bacterium]MDD3209267.1 agmatinase family protein [Bacteroidales bacterium]MDD4168445.1 agmatinase family protein [Bacteroidales bacterium]MDD5046449.1 agmatinase family protein [Bacteroidales bacterium]MDD5517378.1 agmatinase family protein [Bacteroidales bacterium]
MNTFDPNLPGVANGRYFALPFTQEEAEIVLISVPWDVTTSYRPGTHLGPEAIIEASIQVDLFNSRVPEAWKIPIATIPEHEELPILNRTARNMAERIIQCWEEGTYPLQRGLGEILEQVNRACARMNRIVYLQCSEQLRLGKLVGVVGGEHSVPLGYLQALGEHFGSFGILHIDAHADLREAYEGFTFSHASIMFNTLKTVPSITSLTQVGVRDYCSQEHDIIRSDARIAFFPDESLNEDLYEGLTWRDQCHRIMESLPDQVYISLDIDGLSPELCPHTGTPVPGGLSFQQVDYLLYLLASSARRIIGFDLCEVAPGDSDPWDAIVGARLLHKICCYSYLNNKK